MSSSGPRASKGVDFNSVISGIFSAVLLNERQSTAYENLPHWPILRQTRNGLPHINIKSFELIAQVLCYKLADMDAEVFGSLIYKLVQKTDAPSVYGHLTSYRNVAKVLNPLFFNDYSMQIDKHQVDHRHLRALRNELTGLTLFDPTNGPGCFLTSALNSVIDLVSSIDAILKSNAKINIGNFVGLVDNEISQELSRLSLWTSYLQYLYKIKQVEGADLQATYEDINIQIGDQLQTDWAEVCPNNGKTLIVGSPTFKGKKNMSAPEKDKMKQVFGTSKSGDADFCSCWLYLAAKYIDATASRCALVLTNSICQGSQVSFIWNRIYACGCEISFAHRSFKWQNKSQHTTGVSVVIIGLSSSCHQNNVKHLYTGDVYIKADCIGPYLIDSTKKIIKRRLKIPLSVQLPRMPRGNMPYENGNLLLSKTEKDLLLQKYPATRQFLKKIVGSKEFIDRIERWCLWIPSEELTEALSIPPIAERVAKVKKCRLANPDNNVRRLAERPHQFREFKSTTTQTLVIPAVSSENRPYIPIGFIGKDTVVSNLAFTIYECPPWVFGAISSRMHIAWIRTVCGGLETRLRYSNTLGYNTFPFPEISPKQKDEIQALSLEIIEERERFCDLSLGNLYSNLPPSLKTLHGYLDECIDRCYRAEPFSSDGERVKFLFHCH